MACKVSPDLISPLTERLRMRFGNGSPALGPDVIPSSIF